MKSSGSTVSAWRKTSQMIERPPLVKNASCDVCIVGAGIAGLSCAYALAREKQSVIVLDDGVIGGGETEHTTAHIVNALDERFFTIEKHFGKEGARLAAESHSAAIDWIEAVSARENIDCNFERVDGYLFLGADDDETLLKNEEEAAKRAGLEHVRVTGKIPVDFWDSGPSLLFPHQAQFHPLLYLKGLAAAIERLGGVIHTGSHVSGVKGGNNAVITTENGKTVTAASVIVATNAPINDGFPVYTKQAPYRTFVIGVEIPAGSVPPILLWDTEDPYHYIRVFAGGGSNGKDLLIVGGEDHKTGQANDAELRYRRLETWSKSRFPMMGDITLRWSGQVMEPGDGMAMIGRNPLDDDNVYIATGDSGNGMTHGTIAGILLTDLILKRKNEWEKLYSPSRFPHDIKEFAKENANVSKQYACLVIPVGKSGAKIPLDSGHVEQRGIHKVAVYCDPEGKLHERSAVCPHKGCIVQWNSMEKSWDCPCHGSRFTATGTVVNGPSIVDLKNIG